MFFFLFLQIYKGLIILKIVCKNHLINKQERVIDFVDLLIFIPIIFITGRLDIIELLIF